MAANSISSSTMVAVNLWHIGWVYMVGATPAVAAAIVNGCCTLMATNPTSYKFWNSHAALHMQSESDINFLEGKKEADEDTNVVVVKTMECQSASIYQVID